MKYYIVYVFVFCAFVCVEAQRRTLLREEAVNTNTAQVTRSRGRARFVNPESTPITNEASTSQNSRIVSRRRLEPQVVERKQKTQISNRNFEIREGNNKNLNKPKILTESSFEAQNLPTKTSPLDQDVFKQEDIPTFSSTFEDVDTTLKPLIEETITPEKNQKETKTNNLPRFKTIIRKPNRDANQEDKNFSHPRTSNKNGKSIPPVGSNEVLNNRVTYQSLGNTFIQTNVSLGVLPSITKNIDNENELRKSIVRNSVPNLPSPPSNIPIELNKPPQRRNLRTRINTNPKNDKEENIVSRPSTRMRSSRPTKRPQEQSSSLPSRDSRRRQNTTPSTVPVSRRGPSVFSDNQTPSRSRAAINKRKSDEPVKFETPRHSKKSSRYNLEETSSEYVTPKHRGINLENKSTSQKPADNIRRKLSSNIQSSVNFRERSRKLPPIIDEQKLEVLPLFETEAKIVSRNSKIDQLEPLLASATENQQKVILFPKEVKTSTTSSLSTLKKESVAKKKPYKDIKESVVVSKVTEVTSRKSFARKITGRQTSKDSINNSNTKSLEEITESDNYPEEFKALINAKKQEKESRALKHKTSFNKENNSQKVTNASEEQSSGSSSTKTESSYKEESENEVVPKTISSTSRPSRKRFSPSTKKPSNRKLSTKVPLTSNVTFISEKSVHRFIPKPKKLKSENVSDVTTSKINRGRYKHNEKNSEEKDEINNKTKNNTNTEINSLAKQSINVSGKGRFSSRYRTNNSLRPVTRSSTASPVYTPTIPTLKSTSFDPSIEDSDLDLDILNIVVPKRSLSSDNLILENYNTSTKNEGISPNFLVLSESKNTKSEKPVSIIEQIIKSITAISTETPSTLKSMVPITEGSTESSAILKLTSKKSSNLDINEIVKSDGIGKSLKVKKNQESVTEKPTTVIQKILDSLSAIQAETTTGIPSVIPTSTLPFDPTTQTVPTTSTVSTTDTNILKQVGRNYDSLTSLDTSTLESSTISPTTTTFSSLDALGTTSINPLIDLDSFSDEQVLQKRTIEKLLELLNSLTTSVPDDLDPAKVVVVTPKASNFVHTTPLYLNTPKATVTPIKPFSTGSTSKLYTSPIFTTVASLLKPISFKKDEMTEQAINLTPVTNLKTTSPSPQDMGITETGKNTESTILKVTPKTASMPLVLPTDTSKVNPTTKMNEISTTSFTNTPTLLSILRTLITNTEPSTFKSKDITTIKGISEEPNLTTTVKSVVTQPMSTQQNTMVNMLSNKKSTSITTMMPMKIETTKASQIDKSSIKPKMIATTPSINLKSNIGDAPLLIPLKTTTPSSNTISSIKNSLKATKIPTTTPNNLLETLQFLLSSTISNSNKKNENIKATTQKSTTQKPTTTTTSETTTNSFKTTTPIQNIFSFLSTIPSISSFKVSPDSVSIFSANDIASSTIDPDAMSTITISGKNSISDLSTTPVNTDLTNKNSSDKSTGTTSTNNQSNNMMGQISDTNSTSSSKVMDTTQTNNSVNNDTQNIQPSRMGKLLNVVNEQVSNSIESSSMGPDYFIFAILPNNTILRKKPTPAPRSSPFFIVGVYPNNTIIRKFPNGTLVPMEPVIRVETVTSVSELVNTTLKDNQALVNNTMTLSENSTTIIQPVTTPVPSNTILFKKASSSAPLLSTTLRSVLELLNGRTVEAFNNLVNNSANNQPVAESSNQIEQSKEFNEKGSTVDSMQATMKLISTTPSTTLMTTLTTEIPTTTSTLKPTTTSTSKPTTTSTSKPTTHRTNKVQLRSTTTPPEKIFTTTPGSFFSTFISTLGSLATTTTPFKINPTTITPFKFSSTYRSSETTTLPSRGRRPTTLKSTSTTLLSKLISSSPSPVYIAKLSGNKNNQVTETPIFNSQDFPLLSFFSSTEKSKKFVTTPNSIREQRSSTVSIESTTQKDLLASYSNTDENSLTSTEKAIKSARRTTTPRDDDLTTTLPTKRPLTEQQKKDLEQILSLEREQKAILKQLSLLTNLNLNVDTFKGIGTNPDDLAKRIASLAKQKQPRKPKSSTKKVTTTTTTLPTTTESKTVATTTTTIKTTRRAKVTQKRKTVATTTNKINVDEETETPKPRSIRKQEESDKEQQISGLIKLLSDNGVTPKPELAYGKSNDAILASLLKERGIGPSTPKSLGSQLREAGLLFNDITTRAPRPPGVLRQGLGWFLNYLAPPPTVKPSRKPKTTSKASKKPKAKPKDQELLTNEPTHITPVLSSLPNNKEKPELSQEQLKSLIKQLETIQKNPSAAKDLDLSALKGLESVNNVQVVHSGTKGVSPRPRTITKPVTRAVTSKSSTIDENDIIPVIYSRGKVVRSSTLIPDTVSNSIYDDDEDFSVTSGIKGRVTLPPVKLRPVTGLNEESESRIRGRLLSAAVNVTRAITGFLGSAFQGASSALQTMIGSGSRIASDYAQGSAVQLTGIQE